MHLEFVGADHEALEEELCRAVADETVALHFAEAEPALAGSTLGGLASQCCAGTAVDEKGNGGSDGMRGSW